MPIAAEDLDFENRLRVLMMGEPKTGKTTCAIATAPGPVRVLLCEDMSALREAKRRAPRGHFDVEQPNGWNSMQKFIDEAKKDAEDGKIKTLVVDPLSDFAEKVLRESFKATLTKEGNEDGRKAYPECTKRLRHFVEQLFKMPCHVIVICHHMWTGPDSDEGLEKVGKGIIPLLPGAARTIIAAKFSDVVWFDYRVTNGKEERSIITGPQIAWGPGCRSLPQAEVLPPDITALIERFNTQLELDTRGGSPTKTNGAAPRPPVKPAALRPVASKPNQNLPRR